MSPPPEDVIDLLIDGKEVLTAKEYDVVRAFFTAPNTFSVTLGSGKTSLDIAKAAPIGALFALRINGVVQFTGFIDGYERMGGGATELAITGRDSLSQLVRSHIEHERSFSNITLEKLAGEAIKGSGIADYSLVFDMAAQRNAVTGAPVFGEAQARDPLQNKAIIERLQAIQRFYLVNGLPQSAQSDANNAIREAQAAELAAADNQTKTIKIIKGFKADKPIKWDVGETYQAALKKETERAGVFLMAGVDPDGLDPFVFLMGAPNGKQAATFWLLNTRRDVSPDNAVLVLPPQLRRVYTGRHTDYIVYGQAGGGKDGRKPVVGKFHDDEAAANLPMRAPWVGKADPQIKSARQANYRARRMRAEECRASQSIVYTIPHRHTMPLIANPAQRAIVAPDTVIHVRDDEHSVDGVNSINQAFWVERVRFHKSVSGGTFTELTLLDPEHLLFGEDEVTRPVPGRPVKKRHKRS